MRKQTLNNRFIKVANEIADEFYPKGKSSGPRRGEFLRDIGLLYVKLEKSLDRYIVSRNNKPLSMKVVMLTDTIISHFEDDKNGAYSTTAYFDLLSHVEMWMKGEIKKKSLVEMCEFVFGFNGLKEFNTVYQKYVKAYNKEYKFMVGED